MGKLTQKAETFQVLRNTGKSIQIIEGQQDRIEPKKNLNLNANVNCNLDGAVMDYSKFRRKEQGLLCDLRILYGEPNCFGITGFTDFSPRSK